MFHFDATFVLIEPLAVNDTDSLGRAVDDLESSLATVGQGSALAHAGRSFVATLRTGLPLQKIRGDSSFPRKTEWKDVINELMDVLARSATLVYSLSESFDDASTCALHVPNLC